MTKDEQTELAILRHLSAQPVGTSVEINFHMDDLGIDMGTARHALYKMDNKVLRVSGKQWPTRDGCLPESPILVELIPNRWEKRYFELLALESGEQLHWPFRHTDQRPKQNAKVVNGNNTSEYTNHAFKKSGSIKSILTNPLIQILLTLFVAVLGSAIVLLLQDKGALPVPGPQPTILDSAQAPAD